jgi:hypothetical protein
MSVISLIIPWLMDPVRAPAIDIISPTHTYRLLQVGVVSLPDYLNPNYFLSSTLIDDQNLSSWVISFGLLYDIGANISNGYAYWSLPTGITATDLDFKVIITASSSLSPDQTDSLAKISGTSNGSEFIYAKIYAPIA